MPNRFSWAGKGSVALEKKIANDPRLLLAQARSRSRDAS